MNKKTTEISINTPYITLGQVLKIAHKVTTGGETKIFLATNKVMVNELKEDRRGRKLYSGDKVKVDGEEYIIK